MFVLYQCMHRYTRIKASKASFRILGFYTTREEALDTIPAREKDDQGEIRIVPSGEFRLLMESTPQVGSRDYETTKLQNLIDMHLQNKKFQQEKIKKRVEGDVVNDTVTVPDLSDIDNIDNTADTGDTTAKNTEHREALKAIPASFEVRNQKYAVVAVIPDYLRKQKYIEVYRNAFNCYLLNFWNVEDLSIYESNPPPFNLSIYGCEGGLFSKEPVSPHISSVEFETWFKSFVAHHSLPTTMQLLRDTYKGYNEEPAISFLRVASTEEELKDWIEKNGGGQEYKTDLAIVPMYESGCIHDLYSTKKKYSNDVLNTLIA